MASRVWDDDLHTPVFAITSSSRGNGGVYDSGTFSTRKLLVESTVWEASLASSKDVRPQFLNRRGDYSPSFCKINLRPFASRTTVHDHSQICSLVCELDSGGTYIGTHQELLLRDQIFGSQFGFIPRMSTHCVHVYDLYSVQ